MAAPAPWHPRLWDGGDLGDVEVHVQMALGLASRYTMLSSFIARLQLLDGSGLLPATSASISSPSPPTVANNVDLAKNPRRRWNSGEPGGWDFIGMRLGFGGPEGQGDPRHLCHGHAAHIRWCEVETREAAEGRLHRGAYRYRVARASVGNEGTKGESRLTCGTHIAMTAGERVGGRRT